MTMTELRQGSLILIPLAAAVALHHLAPKSTYKSTWTWIVISKFVVVACLHVNQGLIQSLPLLGATSILPLSLVMFFLIFNQLGYNSSVDGRSW